MAVKPSHSMLLRCAACQLGGGKSSTGASWLVGSGLINNSIDCKVYFQQSSAEGSASDTAAAAWLHFCRAQAAPSGKRVPPLWGHFEAECTAVMQAIQRDADSCISNNEKEFILKVGSSAAGRCTADGHHSSPHARPCAAMLRRRRLPLWCSAASALPLPPPPLRPSGAQGGPAHGRAHAP